MFQANSAYWSARYKKGETGWDLNTPSPAIKHYLDHLKHKELSILIPGAGYGHEVAYAFENGFKDVYYLDFSKKAVEGCVERYPSLPKTHIICEDFFDLTMNVDVIIEQTFFCAIPPEKRMAYVQKASELLTQNGKLVGVLFNRQFEVNPPFGGSKQEYQRLFKAYFHINCLENCQLSIAPRKNTELWIECTKKKQ